MKLTAGIDEKKAYRIFFGLLTFLFVFSRLLRLDSVPFSSTGMHFDEISAAYDAWCIQGWGVDRHLTRFPVYFMNTGPGQNALYIYLAAIMFKCFGFSLFKFRLVAVICALGAYVCLFFFSRRVFGSDFISLVPNALMTVMPVFIMSEHWGLESYLFLSFSIISFSILDKAVRSGKKLWYLAAGISWGVTFYTYGISYLVVPLFLLLSLLYLVWIKKADPGRVAAMLLPVVLLGFPLAVEQLVIAGMIKPFSLGFMDFFPMDRSRGGEIAFQNIPGNLITSPKALFVKDFLFYNSSAKFGTLFYISLPFMLIGAVKSLFIGVKTIKSREYSGYVLVLLFYAPARLISLMTSWLNINKANELYFPYLFFTAAGIAVVYEKIGRKWILILISGVYAAFFLVFAFWMYTNGEDSWNSMTKPRYEENLIEDTHPAQAAAEALEICGDMPLQMIINDIENRYLQICLYTGTSPYDFDKEGYDGKNYMVGVPDDLDLSGNTAYLIEDRLHHITDYLVTEGFTNHVAKRGEFSIVYREKDQ